MGNIWSQYAGEEALPEPEPELPRGPLHPYYPEDVALPGYAPNEAPMPVLIAALAGMLGFALLAASVAARQLLNPRLAGTQLALFCWFVLCMYTLLAYVATGDSPRGVKHVHGKEEYASWLTYEIASRWLPALLFRR